MANPAETAYLNVRDRELSNAIRLVQRRFRVLKKTKKRTSIIPITYKSQARVFKKKGPVCYQSPIKSQVRVLKIKKKDQFVTNQL